MSGFRVFARKELREIVRTWRIWVLPGILLFFALTGPASTLLGTSFRPVPPGRISPVRGIGGCAPLA